MLRLNSSGHPGESMGANLDQTTQVTAIALNRRNEYLRGFGLLLVIAVAGLAYVKWEPYWARSFVVAVSHNLGASIVSGQGAVAPEPSLAAAWDYARVYFDRIWMAMVLGLLLAATVDALVPHDWLARVLGSTRLRSTGLGALLALPGMM